MTHPQEELETVKVGKPAKRFRLSKYSLDKMREEIPRLRKLPPGDIEKGAAFEVYAVLLMAHIDRPIQVEDAGE